MGRPCSALTSNSPDSWVRVLQTASGNRIRSRHLFLSLSFFLGSIWCWHLANHPQRSFDGQILATPSGCGPDLPLLPTEALPSGRNSPVPSLSLSQLKGTVTRRDRRVQSSIAVRIPAISVPMSTLPVASSGVFLARCWTSTIRRQHALPQIASPPTPLASSFILKFGWMS